MPQVKVVADDGWVALDEHVTAPDFESEHFRAQLGERLAWAAEDAQSRHPGPPFEAPPGAEEPRFSRVLS